MNSGSLNIEAIHQILAEHSPPWARRIGISLGLYAAGFPPPAAEQECVPLPGAFSGSIDAAWICASDAPGDARELIAYLDALAPGGALFLETDPERGVTRRELREAATGLGLDLLRAAPASRFARVDSAREIVHLEKRPRSDGRGGRSKRISLIVVDQAGQERGARVLEWRDFLRAQRLIGSVEIVIVEDGPEDVLPRADLKSLELDDACVIASHYRRFGPALSLSTALTFARGDLILIDADQRAPCDELYALFDASRSLAGLDRPMTLAGAGVQSALLSGAVQDRAPDLNFYLLNREARERSRGVRLGDSADIAGDFLRALLHNGAGVRRIPIRVR